jgi:hypothetical protein
MPDATSFFEPFNARRCRLRSLELVEDRLRLVGSTIDQLRIRASARSRTSGRPRSRARTSRRCPSRRGLLGRAGDAPQVLPAHRELVRVGLLRRDRFLVVAGCVAPSKLTTAVGPRANDSPLAPGSEIDHGRFLDAGADHPTDRSDGARARARSHGASAAACSYMLAIAVAPRLCNRVRGCNCGGRPRGIEV